MGLPGEMRQTTLRTGINEPWASPGKTGVEEDMRFLRKGMDKTARVKGLEVETDREWKH